MANPHLTKRQKLKLVATGILVRLFGVALILLGDGHSDLWSKILVIVGVIITVTGIGILRYLLLQPLFSRFGSKIKAP